MNTDWHATQDDDAPLAAINTTPLVDVMLVLLIIFMITIPVAATSVAVQLPKERTEAHQAKGQPVLVSVDRHNAIYWHEERLADSAALLARLQQAARRQPPPEVQIYGDSAAQYAAVGRILRACQRAGLVKITFVTEPPALGDS